MQKPIVFYCNFGNIYNKKTVGIVNLILVK